MSPMRDGRETAAKRGYGARWQKVRKAYLAAHPLCVECEKRGIVTLATDLDHIIPHNGDMKVFWDNKNWQGLCHEDHSRKTAREDQGFGNKGGKVDAACGVDGVPTDGRHHWR